MHLFSSQHTSALIASLDTLHQKYGIFGHFSVMIREILSYGATPCFGSWYMEIPRLVMITPINTVTTCIAI